VIPPHLLRIAAVAALLPIGCVDALADEEALRGEVRIDGSSTVYPVQAVAAETFAAAYPDVRITVGVSGTRGGLRRLCAGDIDVAEASRPMTATERDACAERGIDPVEVPVAMDGVTIVVPAAWDLACLTLDELRRLWRADSEVRRWSDLRPGLPDEGVVLFGAGPSSGTFDVFTEMVLGTPRSSRPDYQASEDDNVIVSGVAGARHALGYLGYGYYAANRDRLAAVAVDAGEGCVSPGPETIVDGRYAPLARPLHLYVDRAALRRPAVHEFLRFFLHNAERIVADAGLQPLEAATYREAVALLDRAPS
jgi:phosphate transport system substrate-binding protein